jgi:hypothetical protein
MVHLLLQVILCVSLCWCFRPVNGGRKDVDETMPAYLCCVAECNAGTRKRNNLAKYPWMDGVQFFSIPSVEKTPKLRRQWISRIRRSGEWTPNKYTRVCSRHFVDGAPTVSNPLPTLFPYNNWNRPTNTRYFYCIKYYFNLEIYNIIIISKLDVQFSF